MATAQELRSQIQKQRTSFQEAQKQVEDIKERERLNQQQLRKATRQSQMARKVRAQQIRQQKAEALKQLQEQEQQFEAQVKPVEQEIQQIEEAQRLAQQKEADFNYAKKIAFKPGALLYAPKNIQELAKEYREGFVTVKDIQERKARAQTAVSEESYEAIKKLADQGDKIAKETLGKIGKVVSFKEQKIANLNQLSPDVKRRLGIVEQNIEIPELDKTKRAFNTLKRDPTMTPITAPLELLGLAYKGAKNLIKTVPSGLVTLKSRVRGIPEEEIIEADTYIKKAEEAEKQRERRIRESSFKDLFESGDYPALITKGFYKGGDIITGGVNKLTGANLSKTQKDVISTVTGETLMFGFFSPAFSTGATQRAKQTVKVKTEADKKKALEKLIKSLREETTEKNIKGVKRIKILSQSELYQKRLDDVSKVLNQVLKEENPLKKKELLSKSSEIFRQAYGKDYANKLFSEYFSQEGYVLPKSAEILKPKITQKIEMLDFVQETPQLKNVGIVSGIVSQSDRVAIQPEKFRQTYWLKSNVGEATLLNLRQKEKQQEKQLNVLKTLSLQAPKTLNLLKSLELQKNVPKFALVPKSTTTQTSYLASRQISRSSTRPRPRQTSRTTKREIKGGYIFPYFSSGYPQKTMGKKRKPKEQEIFTAEIKRFGKFRPVARGKNPFRISEIARQSARSGLGASVRVKKSKGGFLALGENGEFRRSKKDPFVLVEKREFRLDRPREIGEIQFWRKQKKRKTKRNKKK